MELRSSKALAWREERGRAGRAAAKRWGGMGVEVEDMVFWFVGCFGGGGGLGWDWGGRRWGFGNGAGVQVCGGGG